MENKLCKLCSKLLTRAQKTFCNRDCLQGYQASPKGRKEKKELQLRYMKLFGVPARKKISCLFCQGKTYNPKFCGMSCAASYNNKIVPKRSPQGKCKECDVPISSQLLYCNLHNRYKDISKVTIGEFRSKFGIASHPRLRDYSRRLYTNSGKPRECGICGYDKHYEVCHIKPLKDFPDEATVLEVNNLDNLIALCRNHHWEMDHDLLDKP